MAATAAATARHRWRRRHPADAGVSSCVLLLPVLLLAAALAGAQQSEEDISAYLRDTYEPQVRDQCNQLNEAEWNYETNITTDTEDILQVATLEYAAFEKKQWQDHFDTVDYEDFKNESLKRQLESLSVLGIPALPPGDLEELSLRTTQMSTIYSTAKICPYKKENCLEDEKLSLDPGIEAVISNSRDYEELKYVWKAWRDVSGKKMRKDYKEYVDLNNKAADLNGFADMGEMWRHDYDSETLREDMMQLWDTIRPLYEELHTYVRRRLKAFYGDVLDVSDDLLPAHVLGNMWAQSWGNIFALVKPFANGSAVNVTQALIDQGRDVKWMFRASDEFYQSLGLLDNSVSYSEKAMLERPKDRDVVCHASAWDFCNGEDFRIKMCTKVNMEDFITIHHEMGHIQYFMQYKDQPYVFRKGANPGFHEAVGDTIALSVSTPKHLKEVGLLDKDYPDTYEDNINALMSMALDKVAFLPFGLLIDMWRWDVFSGKVHESRWNEHWWDLRKEYQRLKPPVERSEDDFDPGAKYHVPGDSQYIAYFIAHVLQFQFHKALCVAAGQYDPNSSKSEPLHKCDIYRSKEAGRLLSAGLSLGGSEHWKVALEAMTGESDYSGEPLLEYFKPLYEFLKEENGKAKGGEPGASTDDDTSQVVPIVVGSVLGAMLVCVLVGYVVFRRRATSRRAAAAPPDSKATP